MCLGFSYVARQGFVSFALLSVAEPCITPSAPHAVDDQSEVLDEVGLDEDDDDETLTKTLFLGDAAERWADG
jgi:hypothetical protein